MKTKPATAKDIDEYIAGFPDDVQEILQQVRATIRKAAPKAEEAISYGIPTFNFGGKYLIYFSGTRKHVGLYPAPINDPEFKEELAPYASGKGTAQFKYNQPIPHKLIARIVKQKAKEILGRG